MSPPLTPRRHVDICKSTGVNIKCVKLIRSQGCGNYCWWHTVTLPWFTYTLVYRTDNATGMVKPVSFCFLLFPSLCETVSVLRHFLLPNKATEKLWTTSKRWSGCYILFFPFSVHGALSAKINPIESEVRAYFPVHLISADSEPAIATHDFGSCWK